MTQSEAIWSAMLLGAIAIALFVVMRIRRRTDDYEQALTFKQRLPAWVHLCEKVIAYACILAIGAIVSWAFYKAHSAIWPGRSIKGATAIFAVIGAASIAIPVGLLCANGVSWGTPALRLANKRAMSGLDVSIDGMNRGLVLAACVSIPLGVAELVIGALEPWAR